MSVTVDHQPMAAEAMGMRTVGQVLSHVQRGKGGSRLVVNLLIDGRAPDLGRMGSVRSEPLMGRTLFIETADPRRLAADVLDEVSAQLGEAERLKTDAIDLLQRNAPAAAMEKLSGCFTTWQNAQESVLKTAQLLRIDLEAIRVAGRSFADVLGDFSAQLKQIKLALEDRDFVTLCDILAYETTQTSVHWQSALDAIRSSLADA